MIENIYTLSRDKFKSMTKAEKYTEVANYIARFGKLPSTKGKPEDERLIGQFWTNSKALSKRENTPQWEIDRIAEIMNTLPNKNNRIETITSIINFCTAYNKTPHRSSLNEIERNLAKKLNTLKILATNGNLSLIEAELFTKIHTLQNNYQKSRREKLIDILNFCKEHGRTPRQHVNSDKNEKRMGEFLSTTKILLSKNNLDNECTTLLQQILIFSPINRMEKLKQLHKFIEVNKSAPKTNSNNITERKLSTFFNKMKTFMKLDKLTHEEIELLNVINNMTYTKSRIDKLNDLYTYTKTNGHCPKLNTENETEQKFAVFFTNMKQYRRAGKLTEAESALLTLVEEFTPQMG